jgi:hypothetical protein
VIVGLFFECSAVGRNRLFKAHRVALPVSKGLEDGTEVGLGQRPLQRHAIATVLFESGAIRRYRLFQVRRPALPLPELPKRASEIVLRFRPAERQPIALPLLKCGAIGGYRLFQMRRPALPFPDCREGETEVALSLCPFEGFSVRKFTRFQKVTRCKPRAKVASLPEIHKFKTRWHLWVSINKGFVCNPDQGSKPISPE